MKSTRNKTGNPLWTKGVSGNPGGRPREIKDLQSLARIHTADCIRALIEIVQSKKAQSSARAMAANALLDRGYGKPTQTVNANVNIIDQLTLDEQRALECALAVLAPKSDDITTH